MDLLLLNDKIGGRLKEGGISFPRFVVPGRRQRGTEGGESIISDTFLSACGSRMMFDETPKSPEKSHKVNYAVTRASGDQNPFFIIHSQLPPSEKAEPAPIGPPLTSARTLHNKRMAKELRSIAGRAGQVHLGAGNSSVLVDCTPRPARWEPSRQGTIGFRLTRNQVAAAVGYTTTPSLSSAPATSRRLSTVPETSRPAASGAPSARGGRGLTARAIVEREFATSRRTGRTEETAREVAATTQLTPLESERQRLMKEMRLLERKLGQLEGAIKSKSNLSRSTQRSTCE